MLKKIFALFKASNLTGDDDALNVSRFGDSHDSSPIVNRLPFANMAQDAKAFEMDFTH